MDTSDLPPTATRDFNIALVLFQVFGLTSIILLGYWEGRYQQATWEWRDPPEQFWYHPLLMTIGFVFIHGNANLVHRVLRGVADLTVKLIHAVLQLIALIFLIVAIVAVFDSHNNHKDDQGNLAPHPNMYSLHSWVGLSVIILFCLQWVVGLIALVVGFLLPKYNTVLRTIYKPAHIYFGVAIYVLFILVAGCPSNVYRRPHIRNRASAGSCTNSRNQKHPSPLINSDDYPPNIYAFVAHFRGPNLSSFAGVMGLTEENFYDVKGFEEKSHEAGLVNTIGYVLILFGLTGTYLLINPKFRRMPRASNSGQYQSISEEES